MTSEEAAKVNEKIAADARRVAELHQDDAKVFEEMRAERERLRNELATAMRESPGVVAQAAA